MIRPIVTSPLMLRMPSKPADSGDATVGQDLIDTLRAHAHECVGMAANMIGVRKQIIAVQNGSSTLLMYNPQILEGRDPFDDVEECLSLPGRQTSVTRFRAIRVSYLDCNFRPRTRSFHGYTAQIIQHEIDHCRGIVV